MRSRLTILVLFASLMGVGIYFLSAANESANTKSAFASSLSESKAADTARNAGAVDGENTPGATNAKGSLNTVRYTIDSGQSSFQAHVAAGGLLSAFGHPHTIAIKGFSGDIQLTTGSLQPASLGMTIKASTLVEVGKEFSEKDQQEINRAVQQEALETGKYPEIVFKSTGISANKVSEGSFQARIAGTLTLHGVTHPISFPAQVKLEGNAVRAIGDFTVLHSAYNIKRLSGGGGTVKAKDPIKLSFNIVANKA